MKRHVCGSFFHTTDIAFYLDFSAVLAISISLRTKIPFLSDGSNFFPNYFSNKNFSTCKTKSATVN